MANSSMKVSMIFCGALTSKTTALQLAKSLGISAGSVSVMERGEREREREREREGERESGWV